MRRLAFITSLLACSCVALAADEERFSGSVMEAHSKKPLRGARVRVKQAGAFRLTADLESGSDGKFRVAVGLPPGTYRIEISKANYIASSITARLPLKSPLRVELARFGSITGRVTDSGGQPLPGAFVMPMIASTSGGLGGNADDDPPHYRPLAGGGTMVDSSGNYRLFDLPPGRYAVAVTWARLSGVASPHAGAYLFPSNARPQAFEIVSGTAIAGVNFTLSAQSEYSVSGRVTGMEPAGKLSVVTLALRDQPALAVAMQRTEPDGTYRFDGIAPGSYELRAAGPTRGYAGSGAVLEASGLRFGRRPVDVAGQNLAGVDVALEPARSVKLAAAFVSPECRAAVPDGVSITMDSLENWGAVLFKTQELSTTGEVEVTGLAPARYRLAVTKPVDGCFGPGNLILDLSGAVSPVRIPLSVEGSIEGQLVGDGAASSPLIALRDINEPRNPDQLTVPEAGAFRFTGLRPGRYRVEAGGSAREVIVRSGEALQVLLNIGERRP
jgi:protocatechuate 3,4-dioxygenase beta subunit